MPEPLLLISACGAGYGHAQRAWSLDRAAAKKGVAAVVVTTASLPPRWCRRYRRHIDARYTRSRPRLKSLLQNVISHYHPTHLIVDSFPRGLVGEWIDGEFNGPRVLIRRPLVPRYDRQEPIRTAIGSYDLVIQPGEQAPTDGARSIWTNPWLSHDATELFSEQKSREILSVDQSSACVVLPRCGTKAEALAQARLALDLRCRAPDVAWLSPRPHSIPPLLRLLPGISGVVGAGGYHTVHECRATQTPLKARPQARRYDQQRLRLKDVERYRTPPELVAWARTLPAKAPRITYQNGVHHAVDAIMDL